MVLRTVLCTELAPKKCSFLFWVKIYWCRFCGISKVKRRVRLDLIRIGSGSVVYRIESRLKSLTWAAQPGGSTVEGVAMEEKDKSERDLKTE